MVMGNSKNLCVFNFAILLKLRKFYAHEIYMFYSTLILILFTICLGRLSSVTTLKLNDNCLSSLPYSIGGYVACCLMLQIPCCMWCSFKTVNCFTSANVATLQDEFTETPLVLFLRNFIHWLLCEIH